MSLFMKIFDFSLIFLPKNAIFALLEKKLKKESFSSRQIVLSLT